jgi:hydrogenase nickel incorporation protein HypB
MQRKAQEEEIIRIQESITEENDKLADETRFLLRKKGILCVNLMGSPGSGKTTIIEGLSTYLSPSKMAVIQGDLESDIDKKRLLRKRIHTVQINTHGGCHLNAELVRKAVKKTKLTGKKYLIVENVGNLVCPAQIQIGSHINIVVSSTTEGSDKPQKYPPIFRDAHIIIISKTDLADAAGFNEKKYIKELKRINPKAEIHKVTSKHPKTYEQVAKNIASKKS